MGRGPGPLGRLIGSQHSESLSAVGFEMGDEDEIDRRGTLH
jgi:hypothetical protein